MLDLAKADKLMAKMKKLKAQIDAIDDKVEASFRRGRQPNQQLYVKRTLLEAQYIRANRERVNCLTI